MRYTILKAAGNGSNKLKPAPPQTHLARLFMRPMPNLNRGSRIANWGRGLQSYRCGMISFGVVFCYVVVAGVVGLVSLVAGEEPVLLPDVVVTKLNLDINQEKEYFTGVFYFN